jgi:hypothetical protein
MPSKTTKPAKRHNGQHTPADAALYAKAKAAHASEPHSAYRSGRIVQTYLKSFRKKHGSKAQPYKGGPKSKGNLSRWFKEKWRNSKGGVGYDPKKKGDTYRPTKRVSKKTPATWSELSKGERAAATRKKRTLGRVDRFKKSGHKKGAGARATKRAMPKRKR